MNPLTSSQDQMRHKLAGVDMVNYQPGGLQFLENLRPEGLNALLDNGFICPDECQNDSPSIAEYKAFAERHPDERTLTFFGYFVSPDRDDCRISLDGITANAKDAEFIADFANTFHEASEFECRVGYQRCWFD